MNELNTYMNQLQKLADEKGINLREAFRKSGVQDSTYHRVNTEEFHLRQDTAQKVWNYIYETHYEKIRKEI
tara:strand:+ start:1119 stop:1331 length:213 start_codon:yes stop_codon:yes gene_type:complete